MELCEFFLRRNTMTLKRKGIATVEKIAINSVMAGAKPEYLPVIITAIECITDQNFPNIISLQDRCP